MSAEANATSQASAASLAGVSFIGLIAGAWKQIPIALLKLKQVEHKAGNYTVLTTDNGVNFTNLGASGTITFTLPPATMGLEFIFTCRHATNDLRVDPYNTEQIESTASPSVIGTAGQYIWSEGLGSSLHLICLEDGKWSVRAHRGTWVLV